MADDDDDGCVAVPHLVLRLVLVAVSGEPLYDVLVQLTEEEGGVGGERYHECQQVVQRNFSLVRQLVFMVPDARGKSVLVFILCFHLRLAERHPPDLGAGEEL